jgi:hypothetical protein
LPVIARSKATKQSSAGGLASRIKWQGGRSSFCRYFDCRQPHTVGMPGITARDAYFEILDDSEWKREQLRTTSDTTNLRRDWLEFRLRSEIHKALRNNRLAAWGEECLHGMVTTPEKPIPPEVWDKVELVFDSNPALVRTAAYFKGRVTYEHGPMAWVGIKFSKEQFFRLFPPGPVPSIDRISCTELMEIAGQEGWDFSSPHSLHLLDLQDAMRQGGADNILQIWGRFKKWSAEELMRKELIVKIEPDHWKDYLFAAREGDNFNTYSWWPGKTDFGRRGYIDLHVERTQVISWLRRDAASFKGKTKPR